MEEPRFNGLNIYGKEIPSRISTKAVWDEISDEESRLAFVIFSNQFVLSERKLIDPDFFLLNFYDLDDEILPLASRKNRIIKAQAGLSGMSFKLYMQSSLLVKWHEHIRGNLTCVDIQHEKKKISHMSQVLKGVKEWELWETEISKPSKEFYSLVKWQLPELSASWWLAQEYSLAKSYAITFVSTTSAMSRRDTLMNKLILEELAIEKKIYSILKEQPSLDSSIQI
jgi:hypothetical protein